jgi:hypothetical protein
MNPTLVNILLSLAGGTATYLLLIGGNHLRSHRK